MAYICFEVLLLQRPRSLKHTDCGMADATSCSAPHSAPDLETRSASGLGRVTCFCAALHGLPVAYLFNSSWTPALLQTQKSPRPVGTESGDGGYEKQTWGSGLHRAGERSCVRGKGLRLGVGGRTCGVKGGQRGTWTQLCRQDGRPCRAD